MSSKLAALQAQANQAAELGPDMNEAEKGGGGGGRLLPEGYAFGRLVEYVEFGSQPREFGGQAKDPLPEAQIGFALWGQGYQNEDGTPYVVRPYSFHISRNEKAKAFKLFKALNWKGTAKHFAQLLSQAYLVKIVHVPKDKAQPNGPKRSVIDLAGFLPPLDPVTKQPYPIPEAPDDLYRLFLWDVPTKDGWDSLFIEGNWEDGKSKNMLQEKCLSALDFQGSPLQQMLGGQVAALPGSPAAAAQPAGALPAAPAVPTQPAAPAVSPAAPTPAAALAATPASTETSSTATGPAPAVPQPTSPSEGAPALPGIPALPKIPGVN